MSRGDCCAAEVCPSPCPNPPTHNVNKNGSQSSAEKYAMPCVKCQVTNMNNKHNLPQLDGTWGHMWSVPLPLHPSPTLANNMRYNFWVQKLLNT